MNMTTRYYTGFKTIVIYEVIRFLRLWLQTLLPPVITMTLYFIIFGTFIGERLPSFNHFTFMQFMAPGLIMMAIINNSFGNVVASFYSLRFQKSIEEILISPLPYVLILIGFIVGGILRGCFVGLLVSVVALFFTHLQMHHLWITLSVSILTATLFSLAGFTNAIYAKNFDDITIIPTFVLTPLTYLGGVFYSIQQLPPAWQFLSKLNPILYVVNAFRYGILGMSDIPVFHAMVMISVITILLFFLNLYLLKKGTGLRA